MAECGYKALKIYQMAFQLAVEVHKLSLLLPKYEMFEEGSQMRRSSKSVAAQIVEGYCLRRNKKEYLLYLNRGYAEAHETLVHLEFIMATGSIADMPRCKELWDEYGVLCAMIFRFIKGISRMTFGSPFANEDED